MVYTDGIHLVAESIPELHTFAKDIELNPWWFKSRMTKGTCMVKPHYDLFSVPSHARNRMVEKAMANGAMMVSPKVLVKVIRQSYYFPETEEEVEAYEKRNKWELDRIKPLTDEQHEAILGRILDNINKPPETPPK